MKSFSKRFSYKIKQVQKKSKMKRKIGAIMSRKPNENKEKIFIKAHM